MSELEEEIVPEDEADNGAQTLKRLREKLALALKEKQEYLDGWQRSRADFANFKREEVSIHAQKEERITSELVEAIIPTLDSFEMALKDATFLKADTNIQKGVEALYIGLLKSLGKVGVKQHKPLGEPFNPHLHEALREVPTQDEALEHSVESVLAAGYTVGERVIRPAQVSVWAYKK